MPKLNDILKTSPGMSVNGPSSKIIMTNKFGYTPKPNDEKRFVDVHVVRRQDDWADNQDDIFQAANIKTYERAKNRYGYDNGEDERAGYIADRSKAEPFVNNEEMDEETYEQMVAEAEQIVETSEEAAKKMAQELADKYYHPHFIHSWSKDWKNPDKKCFGVVSKRHYDNDDARHYNFHLTHIVHPTPPEPIQKFKTKSSRKAVKQMKEDNLNELSNRLMNRYHDKASRDWSDQTMKTLTRDPERKKTAERKMRNRGEGVNRAYNKMALGKYPKQQRLRSEAETIIANKGDVKFMGKHGDAAGSPGFKVKANDNKPGRAKVLPFKRRDEQYTNPKAVKGPTPGQTKEKRFSFLKKAERCGLKPNPYSMSEDTITEVSKALLGRYIKGASWNANKHSIEGGKASKVGQRTGSKASYERAAKHYGKATGRAVGISHAVDKLTGKARVNAEETLSEKIHRRFMPRRSIAKPIQEPQNDKQPNQPNSRGQDVNEHIDVGRDAGATIHDFVHSKNKKFGGKSKKERIRMALGAFYAHHRGGGSK